MNVPLLELTPNDFEKHCGAARERGGGAAQPSVALTAIPGLCALESHPPPPAHPPTPPPPPPTHRPTHSGMGNSKKWKYTVKVARPGIGGASELTLGEWMEAHNVTSKYTR